MSGVPDLHFVVEDAFHLLFLLLFVKMALFLVIIGLVHLAEELIPVENFSEVLFLSELLEFVEVGVFDFLDDMGPRLRRILIHFFYPNQ